LIDILENKTTEQKRKETQWINRWSQSYTKYVDRYSDICDIYKSSAIHTVTFIHRLIYSFSSKSEE